MTTDYGIRCPVCGEDILEDNMHQETAAYILRNQQALVQFGRAFQPFCGEVLLKAYFSNSLEDWFVFLTRHEEHAHELIIVDEYGVTYPSSRQA